MPIKLKDLKDPKDVVDAANEIWRNALKKAREKAYPFEHLRVYVVVLPDGKIQKVLTEPPSAEYFNTTVKCGYRIFTAICEPQAELKGVCDE